MDDRRRAREREEPAEDAGAAQERRTDADRREPDERLHEVGHDHGPSVSPYPRRMDVAIVGGTGDEGFGLTLRLAAAGHAVTIGSRDAAKAEAAVATAKELLGASAPVAGATNVDAVAAAPVVILTVPFAVQADTCRSIASALRADAIVCDASSPLATAVGGRPWQVVRPWHGSAAEQAQALLGDRVRVVAAFQTIAASALRALDRPVDSDVLVCGDDADAKATIGSLVEGIPGMRWVDCGALSQARIAETLTALLISVNRAYKVHDAGFRVTGRDGWGRPGA